MTLLKTSPFRRTRQRGMVLLPVTFVLVTVVGLSVGMLEHGLAEKTALRQSETSAAALELAEIGLAKAEMELRGGLDLDGDGLGTVEGVVPGGLGRSALQYEVMLSRSVTNPGVRSLQAVGQANLSVRRVLLDLQVSEGYRFRHALWATHELHMDDAALTMSYDSRDASLPAAEQSLARLGRAAFESGHVFASDEIHLRSRIQIKGDATPGPGGELHVDGSGVQVSGSRRALAEEPVLEITPEAEFAAALANHDGRGIFWTADTRYRRRRNTLDAGGQAIVVFPGGTYFFRDLLIRDDAKVVFQGPSKIYVTGRFEVESTAEFNVPGRPQDVQVFAHPYDLGESFRPSDGPILFASSVRAALTLYAPRRNVKIDDTAVVLGALVGRDIEVLSDAEVQFDLALEEIDATAPKTTRVAWREPLSGR